MPLPLGSGFSQMPKSLFLLTAALRASHEFVTGFEATFQMLSENIYILDGILLLLWLL